MSTIEDSIASLRQWETPRKANHRGEPCPFPLVCYLSSRAAYPDEIQELKADSGLSRFWSVCDSAELFKDAQFGQWGVQILTPTEAKAETEKWISTRPDDFESHDLVFARFFGDSDLLVIDGSKASGDHRSVLVALPFDPRSDWPKAGKSFEAFLQLLIANEGDKYWEVAS